MAAGLVDMSARECRERLARGGVGRVVLCGPGGPEIYPVNFAVVDGDIVFRTAPYTSLGRAVVGSTVAFEVDDYDGAGETGWSIVVKGIATAEDDPDEVIRLRRLGPQPWPAGHRPLFVRVRPRKVSGRHVSGDR